MAETNGLLNRRTGKSGTEGSNPSVSATQSANSLTGEKLHRQTAQFRAFPADNPYQGERITERICAQLPRFLHGPFA